MKDWEETLKEKSAVEQMPLPDGDWEWFELNKLQPFLRRRRLLRLCSSAAGLAVAASLAVIFIRPSKETALDSQPERIVESTAPGSFPSRIEAPQEVQINNTVIRPELLSIDSTSIEETEIDFFENNEPVENQVSSDTLLSPTKNTKKEEHYPVAHFITEKSAKSDNKHHLSLTPLVKGFGGHEQDRSTPNHGSAIAISFPKAYSHQIPISIGMEVNRILTSSLIVTSGIEMSLYRSQCTYTMNSITQNAYYLGIPLRLDWTVWENGPLGAWVGAGGKVDRLVYGKLGSERISDNTFHWSATAVAGIQYELWRNVGVFVEPELSYYFKPSDPVIQTYRTENPLMFTLGAGLRINLR